MSNAGTESRRHLSSRRTSHNEKRHAHTHMQNMHSTALLLACGEKGGGHARAKPNDHHDQHEDKELKAGAHAQDEQRTRKSEDGPRAYDLFVTSKGNHGKQVV